eukprot:g8311.t1
MSGKYPATLNLTDFIPGHWRPYEKLVVPKMNLQLPLKEVSLAEMVKPAGYVSGSFGKWHLGGPGHNPDKQGFDDWVVTGGRHFAPNFRTTPKTPVKKGEYLGDFLTRQAERFMEKNRDKPFLLYLPHYAVHIPLEAKRELVEKYRKKAASPSISVRLSAPKNGIERAVLRFQIFLKATGKPNMIRTTTTVPAGEGAVARATIKVSYPAETDIHEQLTKIQKVAPRSYGPGVTIDDLRITAVHNPTYAAMVEHIDQSLGRVLKKLDELKLADNTIVIFFSDNGGLYRRFDERGPAVMSNHPLRGEKGTLYEGGIREPCIVRWPGVVKPGSECETPITSVDFWPTIAEIAGTASKFQHRVDGVSLLSLLKQSGELKDRALYWHYPHYHHTAPAGAIRHGDFKLIEYFEDGKLELFNLAKDQGELHDLAKSQPKKAQELLAMLKAWRKQCESILAANVWQYETMPADARRRLLDITRILVAEKYWEGCGGLKLNDEIRVTIAGHAGLLLVGWNDRYFDRLKSILVYPDTYVVPEQKHLPGGIVEESMGIRLGEAWHQGPVILSWANVNCVGRVYEPGRNVVVHEFAHVLDTGDDAFNGTPPLDSNELYDTWRDVMTAEFHRLRRAARRGKPTLLDQYGTENEAEFFAVAAESFFEQADELADRHPQLYNLLRDYFRQDPARWGVGA